MTSVTQTSTALDDAVDISADQVAFYQEHGWIKVENVLPREVALELRDKFLELAALTRPIEAEFDVSRQNYHEKADYRKQHLVHRELLTKSPEFQRAIMSRRHGSVAAALMKTDEVQMFRASVFEKLPEGTGGGITKLHQDAPYAPLDRNGGVSVWIALDDLEPEMGTLQFVDGSHRFGSLGRDEVHRPDFDYLKQRAEDENWQVTPGLKMNAGDATIHHDLTVHMAGSNSSDRPRLAITSLIFPSHALFNGAPHPATAPLNMVVNKPFPAEHFPIFPR